MQIIIITNIFNNLFFNTCSEELDDAWEKFFEYHASHRLPLAEAQAAYEAIGYKAVRFDLGCPTTVKSVWDEDSGCHVTRPASQEVD